MPTSDSPHGPIHRGRGPSVQDPNNPGVEWSLSYTCQDRASGPFGACGHGTCEINFACRYQPEYRTPGNPEWRPVKCNKFQKKWVEPKYRDGFDQNQLFREWHASPCGLNLANQPQWSPSFTLPDGQNADGNSITSKTTTDSLPCPSSGGQCKLFAQSATGANGIMVTGGIQVCCGCAQ